jgi:putative membrane protein
MRAPLPAPRAPAAFRLDDPAVTSAEALELDALDPVEADALKAVETIAHRRRGVRWGAIALSTAGGLVSLTLGLALDSLVRGLFARTDWLGWIGLALVALFVAAVIAVVGREALGLLRLTRLAKLRLKADALAERGTRDEAAALLRQLLALYATRPDTAHARRLVAGHMAELMDGRDLLGLAERDLIAPLDVRAKALASAAARRVSVVTAVSPRAFFDVLNVLWESLRLIRRIAALYGGRPGALGLLRLLKAVLSHLAVTGSMAVGDTILQQFVGHGLAGRLSAKLGEGVVNGLMTARIGLSAIDVCRPLPFLAEERPRLKDLTGDLISLRRDMDGA